jgi:uncharacterized membrane protein YkvI
MGLSYVKSCPLSQKRFLPSGELLSQASPLLLLLLLFVVVVVVVSGSRGMFEELVRVAGRGVGKKFTITVVDAVTVVGDVDAWMLIQALIPPVEGGD